MKMRHMRPINWLRVAVILGAGALLVTLFTCSAKAGELAATWTTPTGNCNNTPLTDLKGYRVRWGMGSVELAPTATSFTVSNLVPGTWWVNIAAFNSKNEESQYAAGWNTVTAAEFVTKTNKVYTFFRSGGNITVVATPHTVPLGTVCDATQSVNGKHKVALEAVTWSGTKLTAALADCG